ncbi:MAG: tail fiber domain-containing protein, partial [bacterium]
ASTTLTGNTLLAAATTTSLFASVFGLGVNYFTTLVGAGLANIGNALSLDLTHANIWTGLQQFLGNASTTQLSATVAYFGGTATSTFTSVGWLGIGTTSPSVPLSVQGNGLFSGNLTVSGLLSAAQAAPSPAFLRTDLKPDVDLAKLEGTATPTVCIVGDSTVSQGNYITSVDSQWSKIQMALRAKYPTKTFTFKDFSIGSSVLNQFTLYPGAFPSWYTNHAATWSSYVAAAGCTSLFISFGMNDGGYQTAASWATVLTAIAAYSPIPDIIISTPIVANPDAGSPYNTAQWQSGNISNASLQRTIALSGNSLGVSNLPHIGLLDIGRYFNMAVFGRDPVEQVLSYVIPPTTPVVAGITTTSTFNYTLPATDGDFDVVITSNNGSAWSGLGSYLVVGMFDSLGAAGTSPATGFAVFSNVGSDCFTNTYYSNGTSFIGSRSWGNWSNTTNTLEVSLQGLHFQAKCNGVISLDQNFPVASTPFTPWIQFFNPPNGTTVTISSYAAGKMRSYTPLISKADCYGSIGGANSGNGINHVASSCLNEVYGTVIDQALLQSGTNVPTYTGTVGQNAYFSGFNTLAGTSTIYTALSGNIGIGTTTPYSRLTVWGPDSAATTSAFSVINNASTTVFAVYDNGNATYSGSIFQSSDQRLKTNIQSLDGSSSLAAVEALNPVSYFRTDQTDQGQNLGFIAQQVANVFPQLVSTTSATTLTPDGTLTLNYVGLIAPIVKAVQSIAHVTGTFKDTLVAWLGDAGNGIDQFFANVGNFHTVNTNQLCLSDSSGSTCYTRSQLDSLVAGSSSNSSTNSSSQTSTQNTNVSTTSDSATDAGAGATTTTQ